MILLWVSQLGKNMARANIWRGNEMHHGKADREEGRRMENVV